MLPREGLYPQACEVPVAVVLAATEDIRAKEEEGMRVLDHPHVLDPGENPPAQLEDGGALNHSRKLMYGFAPWHTEFAASWVLAHLQGEGRGHLCVDDRAMGSRVHYTVDQGAVHAQVAYVLGAVPPQSRALVS